MSFNKNIKISVKSNKFMGFLRVHRTKKKKFNVKKIIAKYYEAAYHYSYLKSSSTLFNGFYLILISVRATERLLILIYVVLIFNYK